MTTALIISTYNWPEALNLVLKSAFRQSVPPTEILVADDGSGQETADLIMKLKKTTSIPVHHVWHEDKGFRRSKILNKAIAQANAEYIVQVDGDCMQHRDFIKDHQANAEENVYLFGSRVNIEKAKLPLLYKEEIMDFNFLTKDITRRTRAFHIPAFSKLYKPKNELSKKVRGCNLSYWKKDFLAVNGYNEDLEGWGEEDAELVARMLNNGVLGKRIRYAGIVYHIWHTGASRSNLSNNTALKDKSIEEKITYCKNGVDKYLNSPES